MSKYKLQGCVTIFDKEETKQKLTEFENSLEKLVRVVDLRPSDSHVQQGKEEQC